MSSTRGFSNRFQRFKDNLIPDWQSLSSKNKTGTRWLCGILVLSLILLSVGIICYYAIKTAALTEDELLKQHERKHKVMFALMVCGTVGTSLALMISGWLAVSNGGSPLAESNGNGAMSS